MFFCDPPGRSDPDALFNFGHDVIEHNYIFFHDQEPIHLDIHRLLFDDVVQRNLDLNHGQGPDFKALVTSEQDSDFVHQLTKDYGWAHYYYFYHGWAALDWYRGYDRTFLIAEPSQRIIKKSFISANRIIGGKRDHRVLLMHHLLREKITNAWISFPLICPAEGINVLDIAEKFGPAVADSFRGADLPLCFPGESDHPMHSCWLSLFDENAESLAHVVTETAFFGRRHHLTEKTFKPICLRQPFILAATAGSLDYLKSYGFQSFSAVWDESYDQESDDEVRLRKIATLLKDLDQQSPRELQQLYRAALPAIEHNYQHFYGGDFEKVLWHELSQMLEQIRKDFNHDKFLL